MAHNKPVVRTAVWYQKYANGNPSVFRSRLEVEKVVVQQISKCLIADHIFLLSSNGEDLERTCT